MTRQVPRRLGLITYLDGLHCEFGIWKKGLIEIVEDELCRKIIELLGKLKRYLYCSGSYLGQGQ